MARIRSIKPEFSKRAIPAEVRRELAVRHGCTPGGKVIVRCAYCDESGVITWIVRRNEVKGWVAFSGLEMDHVVSEFHGGETTAKNIVLACRRCNRSKGTNPSPRRIFHG